MRSRNLTPTIAAYLIVLVVLTAGLTDLILLFTTQNLLIQSLVQHQRQVLGFLQERLEGAETADTERLRSVLQTFQARTDGNVQYSVLHMATEEQIPVVVPGADALSKARMRDALLQSIRTGREETRYHGTTFGVFRRQHKTATVVLPLQRSGRSYAAIAATFSLEPIYQQLRQTQSLVLLYVVLNTLVLTALGTFWLSRITVQPLRRLVQMADQRRGEYEFFHLGDRASNDVQRLSNSLNQMLMRIRDDRQQLQHTIASLEKANRQLKEAKDKIVRTEKMASVGRMASGIAHEIGNPIGIVLGYLQMSRRADISEDKRQEFLERSETEVQRIRSILHQLLHFSRNQSSDRQWVSIHSLLADLLQSMAYQPAMKHIRVQSELKAEEDAVFCDELQLRQVLLNLLINAVDSIEAAKGGRGGRIDLRTENVAETSPETDGTAISRWLQITVSDNGAGFSSEGTDNIFDPFYTTKEPGKGTGLGLSVSFTIVENLGGRIRAIQPPDGGASLVVQLPLQERSETPDPRSDTAPDDPERQPSAQG